MSESVASRLQEVRASVDRAAVRAGRDPKSVTLVAVSKKQPASAIVEAHAAGHRDFGENYVQELGVKAVELASLSGLRWHAIGALQRNKAKDVVRVAHVVHTIDREDLAREVAKRAASTGRAVDVLVQVDLADEAQKAGCPIGEVPALVGCCVDVGLSVVGLMAIPPASDDAETVRPHFARLRELRDELVQRGHGSVRELSMGMSHDFEVAIEEGATIVRVGTAIFGARV